MSKFNKIISIILVTIMIGLIPINTHNVKAYENEEIQIKSVSATGLIEEILLFIIYSLLGSGLSYTSNELGEGVAEHLEPKVTNWLEQRKAITITAPNYMGPKREDFDSDEEFDDAWTKWMFGHKYIKEEDGNYVNVINSQSEGVQKVLELGKKFLDSFITDYTGEGTTEYVQSIIYDKENRYYSFGGINSPFQAWEEFDRYAYPNQVIFTTRNWRAFLVATDGEFYIRKTHNGLYSYNELVSTSGKMAVAFKEYDVWSNYHNLSIYDRYVWQVSSYDRHRVSLEYLDEFKYSTQNIINENDEIIVNKNVKTDGSTGTGRIIWSMLPDGINKVSPYNLNEYPYQLLFATINEDNEVMNVATIVSENPFIRIEHERPLIEWSYGSLYTRPVRKQMYISEGEFDWGEEQISNDHKRLASGKACYRFNVNDDTDYNCLLIASNHDITYANPEYIAFEKNISEEDEIIGVEKIIPLDGIIYDPRMLERAIDPMPNSKDTYEDKYIKVPENQTDISTKTPTDVVGDIVEQDGEEVFVPVPDTFPQDIDRVGDFPGTIEGINAGVKTVNWQLTKIRELIGDLAISTPATPDMHLEVPEGKIDIALPNILILLLGVLAAIIRLVIRFLIFIKDLVLVAPSNAVIPDEMILGLEFLKNHQIPYFNLSFYNLFSLLMMFMFGVKIIKLTKRYVINYVSDFSNIDYETMKIDPKLY